MSIGAFLQKRRQVRHGESVLWRTASAFGAAGTPKRFARKTQSLSRALTVTICLS